MRKNDNGINNGKIRKLIVFAVSAVIAIALVITGALCFTQGTKVSVPDTPQGSVSASGTNRGAITGTTFVTNIKNGTYVVGDYLEYSSAGAYNVTLVKGTYKLEVWGAQGGKNTSSNGHDGTACAAGGLGGYTYATFTVTANSQTLYIGVGGYPGNSTSGGWNGGGSTGSAGRGGGGASHIATATSGNGELRNLSSNTGAVLIVAGGGGGSQWRAGGGGGGGNRAGNDAVASGGWGSPGKGATTSGAGGPNSGGFGYGGAGTAGGDGYYGGAGGGGYWGGGGGSSDGSRIDDYGGGGGSGYVKSGLSGDGTSNTRSNGGLARITINSFSNSAPTTKSFSLTGKALGATTQTVNANQIGQDPDATVNTNGAATTVYFQTQQLYLDSACTTAVSTANYFTYSFSSASAFSITSYNKLPRSGTNGQANNTLTVYCKIKDNFTQSVATSTLSFTISFSGVALNHATNTTGLSNNDNTYRFGKATTTDVNQAPGGALYGSAVNAWTVTVQKPIKIGSKIEIDVTKLFSGFTTTYYAAYIVPSAATSAYNYTGSTTATIYDFTSGSSYTSKTGYSKLTINGVNPAATWQRITATVYLVEKSSVGATNREPTSVTYDSQSIEINFRVDNTRPVLNTTNNVINVAVGGNASVSLATVFSDADETITASTHSIKEVKVPTNEFIQLDKYSNVVSTVQKGGAAANISYYNVKGTLTGSNTSGMSNDVATGFKPGIASTSVTSEAFVKYSFSGITLTLTGLRPSYSLYASNRTGLGAYTGGTMAAPTGTATVQNPGHFYLLVRIQDNNDTADTGIWRPVAITVGGSGYNTAPVNTGSSTGSVSLQGTVPNMPTAEGTVDQEFYFAPMAINVNGTQHVIGSNVKGGAPSVTLQPLALDADNFSTTSGLSTPTNSLANKLNEFITISSTAAQVVSSLNASEGGKYIEASLFDLYVPASYFGGRVCVGSGSVSGVKYVSLTADGDYYKFSGLKIKLKNSTLNRYFHATVNVKDAGGSTVATHIAIRVKNTAPTANAADNVATYRLNEDAYSAYENSGVPTLKYRVPLNSRFFITPYDVISDYNMTRESGNNVFTPFTLNGFSGSLDGTTFKIGGTGGTENITPLFDTSRYGTDGYKTSMKNMLASVNGYNAIGRLSAAKTFASSAAAGNAYRDRLFFARSSDPTGASADAFTYNPTGTGFNVSSSSLNGYINVVQGNTVNIDGNNYALDFLFFKAITRTVQPGIVTLTVRDRSGNSVDGNATITVRIEIEVVNTAPALADPSAIELKADNADTGIMSNVADIYINSVMNDYDGDTLYLIAERGLLVANTDTIRVSDLTGSDGSISFGNIAQSYLTDALGNQLTTHYVSAQMLSVNAFSVRALGSTKNIEGGVFVYFFVTDNRGGETLGYKQIEVVNTAPALHIGEDGFDGGANLWDIDVARAFDITRERYIVGSETARDELLANSVAPVDIKLIATDADSLSSGSGVLLSPRNVNDYVLLNTASPDYMTAVPNVSVATSFSGRLNDATAVLLFTKHGTAEPVASIPSDYAYELLFFVNGNMYNRAQLVTALQNDVAGVRAECFDAEGRWILVDFALRLRATQGFEPGMNIGITLSIADEPRYGGDTAGLDTAYNKVRKNAAGAYNREKVDGRQSFTVYQHIGQTGIITKDDFAAYGNYYVVDVPTGATGEGDNKVVSYEQYVPTYDGDTASVYPAGQPDLYYKSENGRDELVSTGTPDTLIKNGAGSPDGTLAGVHSGTRYADWSDVTLDRGESAYRYPDTIVVPSTKTGAAFDTVYVPMSFFGMLSGDTIATSDDNGNVKYSDNYVTFDTRTTLDNKPVDESVLDSVAAAITLTDGKGGEWTGNKLGSNPYIKIETVGSRTSTDGANKFGDPNSVAYYNRAISVASIDETGALEKYIRQADKANHNSYVGDGKVLYLENQATKLKEHNFGLAFTKKNMRTGVSNLTLTVKLVKAIDGATAYESEADAKTVRISIRIDNSKIDLVTGVSDDTKNNVLGFDDTYYVDVEMATATTSTFALARKGSNEYASADYNDIGKIYYTDDDYEKTENDGSAYRDYAYFSGESVNKLSAWKVDPSRPKAADAAKTILTNVAPSANNMSSIKHFYDEPDVDGIANKDPSYQPNGGIYGTNNGTNGSGAEGFGSYFSLSYSDSGRMINIMSSRKTIINDAELQSILNAKGLADNETNVKKIYAERGLVAEYADGSLSRVYYPLKIMVYDDCGAGWDEASYTAVEFRITITNAAPGFRSGIGRVNNDESSPYYGELEYHFNLAVNGSTTFNLYDFLSDADIYATGTGMYKRLATENDLLESKDAIIRETGDYLKSPLVYSRIEPTNAAQAQANLEAGTAGFSEKTSTAADVIMWMSLKSGETLDHDAVVSSNEIGFTVNRRTTKSNGDAMNSFRFKLYFADNNDTEDSKSRTGYITFVVNVINQAPRIDTYVNSVTMRAGDTLTVMTAYYDVFVGGENYTAAPEYKDASGANIANHEHYLPTNHGTTAYKYSKTRKSWNSSSSSEHSSFASWNYHELTSDAPLCGDDRIIRDTTSQIERNTFMGYLGIATDDTPWSMRIDSVETDRSRITVQNLDNVKYENSNVLRPVAVTLKAIGACTDQAVTFTISDGEATAVYTLYVTIVSAPPIARDANDVDDRIALSGAHLEGVLENGIYKEATYRTFVIPSADRDVDIVGIGTKRAYKKTTITMQSVATDPDGVSETATMALYNNGMFKLNGSAMSNINNVYTSDYLRLTVSSDGRSFDIEAIGYNPDAPYETLTFTIGDSGNNVMDNAITITVHVYTVHSDLENPSASALTDAALDDYLAGGTKVHVKTHDEYYGVGMFANSDGVGKSSRYAFLKLDGKSEEDPGNVGNDGNTARPIIDPDVADHGVERYTARVFAFINDDGTELEEDISEWFDVSSRTKTFKLKDSLVTSTSEVYNKYLIGGVLNNGSDPVPIATRSIARLAAVNEYVEFSVASDGTNITFIPKTATFDKKILLYIEVEKYLGTGNIRSDGVLRSGTLFSLDVEDSAPRNAKGTNIPDSETVIDNNFYFDGMKGDSVTYTVFDAADNSSPLFVDSDRDDEVRLDFDPSSEQSYETALAAATAQDPELDWRANTAKKKDRAIDVSVTGNTVTVKINRRMDKLVNGVYADSVTFPFVLRGVDRAGKTCEVTLMITVRNTPISARTEAYESFDTETRVGFAYRPTASAEDDGGNDYACTVEARVLQNGLLTVNIADFLTDADYTVGGDTDSYRFVGFVKDTKLYNTLIKDPVKAINIGDSSSEAEDVALVSAVYDDDWHFTGFTVKSLSTKRELTGTVYLRIVDRACDSDTPENGLTVRVDITVMNDRPFVKEGMNATTLTLVGTEQAPLGQVQKDPQSKTFSIGDFVGDNNDTDVVGDLSALYPNTCLRIYSLSYLNTDEVYSTADIDVKPGTAGDDGYVYDSSELFTATVDIQNYNQLFTITPRLGYYGKGAIEITVADGDRSVDAYALEVKFRINVEIVYDPEDISSLKSVQTARGKNVTISIDSLIPDIASTLADGNDKFNPSSAYIMTALEFVSGTSDYLERVDGLELVGGVCVLRAKKITEEGGVRINVRYALKSDPTTEYSGYFYVIVSENNKPTILYESLTFIQGGGDVVDPLRTLDTTQTVYLRPDQLLDDPENDIMHYVSVSSQKPSLVSVSLNEDKTLMSITFNGKGSAKITMVVVDETGEACERYFVAKNEDLPSPNMWISIAASFEGNKLVWVIVICLILLLLIIMILLISRSIKRKHEQEQLEALMVSEMAIEDQMAKLAAGPAPTDYLSYGYMPPADAAPVNNIGPVAPPIDPSTTLGAGQGAPASENIALNPGTENPDSNSGM